MQNSFENNCEKTGENTREKYERPSIEIIEMETEGSILQGSDFNPGGGGGDW